MQKYTSARIYKTGVEIQINMEGGQSGTYLRLMRASSGPQVSVAKTYRDETKRYGRNINFRFVSFLYVLVTLTRRPEDALVSLR